MHHEANLLVTVELVIAPQSIPPVERLVSLTAALLHRPMTRDEILSQVTGYRADRNPRSAARMFERDKELLREQGMVLIATQDVADGQTFRYWIDDSAWSVGDLKPNPTQIALLSLAVAATTPRGRHLPGRALTKLRALSRMSNVDADIALTTSLDLTDPEESFDILADAITAAELVSFKYRNARGEVVRRRVAPWRLVRSQGGWYLVGQDLANDERRCFRLSRFQDEAMVVSSPGAYQIPPDADFEIGEPPSCAVRAEIAVAPGAAIMLRRGTEVIGHLGDHEVIEVKSDDIDRLAQLIASYGGDAIAVSPTELVNKVRDLWEKAANYAS